MEDTNTESLIEDAKQGASEIGKRKRFGSLNARVMGWMSVALLPLGLIALVQSLSTIDAARESDRERLAGQTFAAGLPISNTVSEAVQLARGLATAVPEIYDDVDRCSQVMERANAQLPEASFVGFIGQDQVTRCNSDRMEFDFSGNPESDAAFEAQESTITFNARGEVSGESVVIVSKAIFDNSGRFLGFLSLSQPTRPLTEARQQAGVDRAVTLIAFSEVGGLLTADVPFEEAENLVPAETSLSDIARDDQHTFTAVDQTGTMRDYAVLPIVPGSAYIMGTWESQSWITRDRNRAIGTLMLPLLMWATSLTVAFLAMRRLVVEPIKALRLRMLNFADGRTIFRSSSLKSAPLEVREIGATFERIAEGVVRNEAALEDQVYERELLLREVHHRVKNNLQLMSSIVNMQIRGARSSEVEDALRGVQGRLASLAKFHRELYSTSALSALRADQVIEDLVRQMIAMSAGTGQPIDLRLDLHQFVLSPDQMSPLSMLVTEALTNSIKYAQADGDERPMIWVSMSVSEEAGKTMCRVTLENTVSAEAPVDADSQGLGTRLITAFAAQLEAQLERRVENGRFILSVTFEREEPEATEVGTEGGLQTLT